MGILVVPSDRLGRFLTDRAPAMADAKRYVVEAGVEDLPLLVMAIEHDGPGPALAKQPKGASSTYPTQSDRMGSCVGRAFQQPASVLGPRFDDMVAGRAGAVPT